MAAMLRDSVVVVAVVRTHPRAIPLAKITMRKSAHGFPFVSYIWDAYGAPRLAALRAAGAPLLCYWSIFKKSHYYAKNATRAITLIMLT